MTGQIYFLLNARTVCTSQPPGLTVLDYLRQIERLVGTKEGCREGGCGACTVLLGELRDERVWYKAVTSCLLPLGELQGKHLVTLEGLNQVQLSPVQQALVDWGATQCGFCAAGIVMSLTGYLMAGTTARVEGIKTALSGNLCRCTGYAALKRAGTALVQSTCNGLPLTASDLVDRGILPAYFRDIPARLRQLPQPVLENEQVTPEFAIAGGTDIYVQMGETLPDVPVRLLNLSPINLSPEMRGISCCDGQIRIGALTTFEEFATHPAVMQLIPYISAYIERIASWQIRHRATVGGNIVGASPIGDLSILLLALDALLVLRCKDRSRTLPLRDFFRAYKDTAKAEGEILTEIILLIPLPDTRVHFEKVSKRQYLDCAAVNSAIAVRCEGDVIREVGISMGGVAPIPLFLKRTSAYFLGKRIDKDTVESSFPILQQEISPRSDVYGSAVYKRLLARQLLIAHFTELFPELVTVREFYAMH